MQGVSKSGGCVGGAAVGRLSVVSLGGGVGEGTGVPFQFIYM